MTKGNDNKKLAIQMLIAMNAGIFAGLIFMAIREKLGATTAPGRRSTTSCSRTLPLPAANVPWGCSTSAVSCSSAPCS